MNVSQLYNAPTMVVHYATPATGATVAASAFGEWVWSTTGGKWYRIG